MYYKMYRAEKLNKCFKKKSQNVWAAAAAGCARIDMLGLLPPAVASWQTLSDLLTPADNFAPFLMVFSSSVCLEQLIVSVSIVSLTTDCVMLIQK